jgi:ankyrin repeat protein
MLNFRNTRTSVETTNHNDIIYEIVTNGNDIEKLIDINNINAIIDKKNKYTALHYAIKMNNEKVIKFLLKNGADIRQKTYDGLNAIDLCLKFQSKSTIVETIINNENEISSLNKDIAQLNKKLNNTEVNNKYLINTIDDLNMKNNILKNENNDLKKSVSNLNVSFSKLNKDYVKLDNNNISLQQKNNDLIYENDLLKKEINEQNKNFDCLNNQYSTLKRKYDKLDESYEGILNSKRK